MVEFIIKITCKKNSEQENQNRTKQKLLKAEALLLGYVYKTGF